MQRTVLPTVLSTSRLAFFVSACLVCVSFGRRVQRASQQIGRSIHDKDQSSERLKNAISELGSAHADPCNHQSSETFGGHFNPAPLASMLVLAFNSAATWQMTARLAGAGHDHHLATSNGIRNQVSSQLLLSPFARVHARTNLSMNAAYEAFDTEALSELFVNEEENKAKDNSFELSMVTAKDNDPRMISGFTHEEDNPHDFSQDPPVNEDEKKEQDVLRDLLGTTAEEDNLHESPQDQFIKYNDAQQDDGNDLSGTAVSEDSHMLPKDLSINWQETKEQDYGNEFLGSKSETDQPHYSSQDSPVDEGESDELDDGKDLGGTKADEDSTHYVPQDSFFHGEGNKEQDTRNDASVVTAEEDEREPAPQDPAANAEAYVEQDYHHDFVPDCDNDYCEGPEDDPYDFSKMIDDMIWEEYSAEQVYCPPSENEDSSVPSAIEDKICRNFIVPERLRGKNYKLINVVNSWHYAMMNDQPRNVFYRDALSRIITPDSVVLEIGAGSGILSIIAASLGARRVVAIEANRELASLAREIVRRNGYENRVHIINNISTNVTPEELEPFGTPTVLLSEILGCTLLSESALHYVGDALWRLAPNATVLPRCGMQFATLIESEEIASYTSVRQFDGIDLSLFNTLQDTTSIFTTKEYGIRMSRCNHRELAPKTPVLEIDFANDWTHAWKGELRQRIRTKAAGTVHAIMASWEAYDRATDNDTGSAEGSNERLTISTHPSDTVNNSARDWHWGQALQLIEDLDYDGEGATPKPFVVQEGEWLTLVTRYSPNGQTMQFQLERDEPESYE